MHRDLESLYRKHGLSCAFQASSSRDSSASVSERDEEFSENVNATAVTGTARVAGKLYVRLHESNSESNFDVLVRGEVLSQLTATHRPVVVLAQGTAPFEACQPIVYQDHQFMAQPLTMDVRNQFTLDEICSYRGGLTGVLTRRIARPFVRADWPMATSRPMRKFALK